MFEEMTVKQKLVAIAAVSLAVHITVIAFLTHLGDPEYWPRIMSIVDSGNGIYGLDGNYYTPVWGYMLSCLGMILHFLGLVPHLGNVFTDLLGWGAVSVANPQVISPQIVLATKIPLAIVDVIVGFQLYGIVKEFTGSEKKGILAMAMWCFCPMVIYMSGVQGQFDCISTMLALATIRLIRSDKILIAGMAFGLSVWLKLFPSVCLFLFVGYLIAKYGTKAGIQKTVVAAVGALAVTVVLLIPMIMNGEVDIAFGFFTGRMNTTTDSDFYNKLVSVRLILMILLTLVLMVFSFLGIRRRGEDADRCLYLYAGVLISVATIISRGYQYVPSFIPFVLLFAMISNDRRSYTWMFWFFGIVTMIDAFFSPGPSIFAIPAVYYGMIDATWLQDITIAFLETVGHNGAYPVGYIFAVSWAVLLWVFVIVAISDLLEDIHPKLKHKLERFRNIGGGKE